MKVEYTKQEAKKALEDLQQRFWIVPLSAAAVRRQIAHDRLVKELREQAREIEDRA